jgi:hypothetical protein
MKEIDNIKVLCKDGKERYFSTKDIKVFDNHIEVKLTDKLDYDPIEDIKRELNQEEDGE